MKNIFALVFLITLSINSFGQISNEKEIYGKWTVEKIIDKPSNPQFQTLIEGFKNSIFTFNQNGDFELSSTSSSQLFAMVIEMTNGTKWKFDKSKQYIKIGIEEDRYSRMGISIRETNGSTLFHLNESGMTFEMKKVE
ncbi:MAG: hypothetical protein JJE55_13595 [Flavobacteriaceae bacterium]|nr:hypothetical protein [Flavobacteriaceae bacterium]